eukprot:511900_1
MLIDDMVLALTFFQSCLLTMSFDDSDSYNTGTDSENDSEEHRNSVDVWTLPSDLNTIKTHSMGYLHQKQRKPNNFQPPSQNNIVPQIRSNNNSPQPHLRANNMHQIMYAKTPPLIPQSQTISSQPLASAQTLNLSKSSSQRNMYQSQPQQIQQASPLAHGHTKHHSLNSKPKPNPFQMQQVQRNVFQSSGGQSGRPYLQNNRNLKQNLSHNDCLNPSASPTNTQQSQLQHIRQVNTSAPSLVGNRCNNNNNNNNMNHKPSPFKTNNTYDSFFNSPPSHTQKVYDKCPQPKTHSNKQSHSNGPAQSYSQQSLKSGFLEKQGGAIKTWKRRWFVLQINGQLSYYMDQKAKKPISVINCNTATALSQESFGKGNKAFGMKMCTPKRNWKFVCKDKQERQEWFSTLRSVMLVKH